MCLYFIGRTVLSVFGAKMFFVNKENISILDYFDTVLVHINYRVATLVKYSKIYFKKSTNPSSNSLVLSVSTYNSCAIMDVLLFIS